MKEDILLEKDPRIVIDLDSEEDALEDFLLENDPRFLKIIERSRQDFQEGKWVDLQSLPD